MNRIAGRAGITLLIVLLLVAGISFFVWEFVTEADEWIVFPGSPHVYNGGNIGCGVVTDRDGALLVDLQDDGRTYAASLPLRCATVHWVGDRNGSISAPALPHYAAEMAGFDLLNGTYSYGQTGGIAELSMSAKLQTAALEALDGRKGTVGVYNYKTGELICAVTSPTYDPDNIPDLSQDTEGVYDGMYLNRFIQSVYIPGSIYKIVTLAAALEENPRITEQTFTCTGTYKLGNDEVVCEGAHWEQTLKDAFRNSCNCAFAQIAQQLGAKKMMQYAEQFKITESVSFDGMETSTGNYDVTNATESQLAWSCIGQYTDQINPCRFMTFMGAIAMDGKGTTPYLVERITVDGTQTYQAHTSREDRIMSTSTAKILKEYLQNNVDEKYGADNFHGLTVCAKTGTGEVGGDRRPNATFAGFVQNEKYPFAFIVAVEDGGYGSTVCIPIISKILDACKDVI